MVRLLKNFTVIFVELSEVSQSHIEFVTGIDYS